MKVMCLDDELLALRLLGDILKSIPDIEITCMFGNAPDALACAETVAFDVAFVDIMLGKTSGLDFAQSLRNINPSCKIIYCTGYAQYAVDSINRGIVDGYLLKPVDDIHVQELLDRFRKETSAGDKLITVKGDSENISILDKDEQPVVFSRKKTLQLFSLLLESNGKSMSTDTLCEQLWEEHKGDLIHKNRQYLYALTSDLSNTLKSHGAAEIFIKTFDGYALDISHIKR